jgi:hypothetical protein
MEVYLSMCVVVNGLYIRVFFFVIYTSTNYYYYYYSLSCHF